MKNESRFRFSHVIVVLFLLGVGCFVGYQFISGFHPILLFEIGTFIVGCVLPIIGAVCIIISDIKNIKSGESTSFYAEQKED